jgi:hydrogenase expression/formation protein HypE
VDEVHRTPEPIDLEGWSCPLPLRYQDRVVLGHGGGGLLSSELVEHLFLPAFGDAARSATPTDSHILDLGNGTRIAFSTDSYVVQPLFFPGGDIGELAVNGTVNDLAMSGARALALSTGFVLEEGLEFEVLGRVATSMGIAAQRAGVELVTWDTKVVERGHGDGLYVNTAGIGLVPEGVDIRPDRAQVGDVVIVSGPIGLHGIAVLSVRHGLEFGTDLRSDTVALNSLVAAMVAVCSDLHVLRDPTRGGLAASLCEIAETAEHQYGASFPITAKAVVNGAGSHPFYKWASAQRPLERPRWNFHKYLIGRDGLIAASFPSEIEPTDARVIAAIEKELGRAVTN